MCMTERGFSWKIWKKNDIRAPCCEKVDIFWQNMGMRATCFLENGHFCQKWAKEQWFFMKYREKRAFNWLFWPIIYSCDRILFFLFYQLWAWQQKVFHEKVDKNDMRALFFWENRRFLTKYGMRAGVFYKMKVFLTKYVHESNDFFVKNQEKRVSYWLLRAII